MEDHVINAVLASHCPSSTPCSNNSQTLTFFSLPEMFLQLSMKTKYHIVEYSFKQMLLSSISYIHACSLKEKKDAHFRV